MYFKCPTYDAFSNNLKGISDEAFVSLKQIKILGMQNLFDFIRALLRYCLDCRPKHISDEPSFD